MLEIFTNLSFLIGSSLMYATPILFAALGGSINEHSGIVNIGLDGLMVVGAFAGATATYFTGNSFLGLIFAAFFASIISLVHALACIHLKADHIISGVAINLIAPAISIFLCRLLFNGAAQTIPIELKHKIPRPINDIFQTNSIPDLLFNQYLTVYLALLLVPATWFFLYKTKIGLHLRSCGENPLAAQTLGINIKLVRYFAVLLSGALAGLGGAALSIAIVSRFTITIVSGQGYIALAAVIFGNWKPLKILLSCFIFGFSNSLIVFAPRIGLHIPTSILSMLPYIITIMVLVIFVAKSKPPEALGKIFH